MRLACILPLLFVFALACGDDDGSVDAGPDDIDSGTDDDGGDDGDSGDDGGDQDGGPARICGGFAGIRCDEGDYCDFEDDLCGAADGLGICRPRPDKCAPDDEPVCACDTMAYDNACEAAMAGRDVSAEFKCE